MISFEDIDEFFDDLLLTLLYLFFCDPGMYTKAHLVNTTIVLRLATNDLESS